MKTLKEILTRKLNANKLGLDGKNSPITCSLKRLLKFHGNLNIEVNFLNWKTRQVKISYLVRVKKLSYVLTDTSY